MKKNALILVLMSFSFAVFAQLGKGTMQVDGSAQLQSYRLYNSDNRFSGLNVSPSFTYFFNKNFALSSQLAVDNSSAKQSDYYYKNLGLTPSLYYFFNPDAKWKAYAKVKFGYEVSKVNYDASKTNEIKADASTVGGAVGVNHFLKPTIALNAELSYGKSFTTLSQGAKDVEKSSYNRLTLSVSLQNFLSKSSKSEITEGLLNKGRIVANGNLIFDRIFNENSTASNITFNGEGGIFAAKNLLIGSGIQLYSYDSDVYAELLPYLNYYIPLKKRLAVFGQIEARTSLNKDDKLYTVVLPGVGMNYFLSQNVAIEAKVSYNYIDFNNPKSLQGVALGANLKYFLK
jgi:hypothetical protein